MRASPLSSSELDCGMVDIYIPLHLIVTENGAGQGVVFAVCPDYAVAISPLMMRSHRSVGTRLRPFSVIVGISPRAAAP